MQATTITLHTGFRIADVDERLFGGFMEHIGRCVYEGLYQPDHPKADEDGFRTDVLAELARLNMTAMRYPGGNFASGYHWIDGVGPRDRRPAVRELAWQSVETNAFGTDEYIRLCRKMGWTPMLTVNLGTAAPEEARNWVEYCNCPPGTKYTDLRAANGSREPYGVRLWCLGNEMDGPWQLGHVPAEQYAIRAQQAAKMMKDADKSIELVAAGSSSPHMPTYMEWDRQVLERLGDLADYVSLHLYVGNRKGDTSDYLAVGAAIDRQIEEMDAVCRFVQAKRRSRNRPFLCFDEWNVWYKNQDKDGEGRAAPALLEEVYNLEDALVVAAFLHSFLRHADVLRIANLSQIANVIAPLLTRDDGVLVQSIFHPFEMFSRRRRGAALRLSTDGPTYESPTHGRTGVVDASAILDGSSLSLFLTNRSLDVAAEVAIAPADCRIAALESGELLTAADPKAANSWEQPDVVKPVALDAPAIRGGSAVVKLPPLSLAAMTLRIE